MCVCCACPRCELFLWVLWMVSTAEFQVFFFDLPTRCPRQLGGSKLNLCLLLLFLWRWLEALFVGQKCMLLGLFFSFGLFFSCILLERAKAWKGFSGALGLIVLLIWVVFHYVTPENR